MKRQIVIALAIMFVVCFLGTTFAEARVGVGRPGVGVGMVGSGAGFRPGIGWGAAGVGLTGPGLGTVGSGLGVRPGIGWGAPGVGLFRGPG
jgi:hypothetical protein